MPGWVKEAFEEYRGRLTAPVSIALVEIPARKRGKNPDLSRIVEDESESLIKRVPKGSVTIALDRRGKRLTTERLAAMLEEWVDHSQDVAFLVGGPEGLSERCLAAARHRFSLSDMTFAHPLVRVILAEQIYRAYSINNGLPYHR
jgi:23S rRNA (pseudouridine1915-N3)-methyltransferase